MMERRSEGGRSGCARVKDGCSPQGQCGCCTVLVDGAPRVACVTPARRVAGRRITTVEGLDPADASPVGRRLRGHRRQPVRVLHARDHRAAWPPPRTGGPVRRGPGRPVPSRPPVPLHRVAERRSTAAVRLPAADPARRPAPRAGRRATIEGGTTQQVGPDVALGRRRIRRRPRPGRRPGGGAATGEADGPSARR